MQSENKKRIAKNTLLLYFRMLLTMLVSLYTVRVVLNTLGTTDYGIYNVVCGIVVMFSFLSGTMTSSSQRFFSFDLGQNNMNQLKRTFSITIEIYSIISLIILGLAETIGLWFLNTQMNIPSERMEAANWIFQFSIFSFLTTIMTVPYNAAIIARENMKVYAYVSIAEVILKLAIVYMLVLFSFDKLKLYACLTFGVSVIISTIYRTICKKMYEECHFRYYWNKELFKTMIGYSGWNLFGAIASVTNNYGINILLNLFFGPVVNAARGIAYQVNSAINQFVMNFLTATRPQIVKFYATGENKQMLNLVFQSSKLAFFLIFALSLPVLLETKYILTLWLKDIPPYVVLFTRLVIITALIDSLSYSLMSAAQATLKIKYYQIIVGSILLFNLPISYFFLKLGYPPQITMYVSIVLSGVSLLFRVRILKYMLGLSVIDYFKNVLNKVFIVSVIAYVIPSILIFQMQDGLIRFFLVCISGITISCISVYFLGLNTNERNFLIGLISKKN